jgi:hypothetical protein
VREEGLSEVAAQRGNLFYACRSGTIFINQSEKIRVDTSEGAYLNRA